MQGCQLLRFKPQTLTLFANMDILQEFLAGSKALLAAAKKSTADMKAAIIAYAEQSITRLL
jgi:hypothetical protein